MNVSRLALLAQECQRCRAYGLRFPTRQWASCTAIIASLRRYDDLYKCLCMTVGLGTALRILTDALDGAVDDAYRLQEIDFRARYYPYFRLLMDRDDLSVGEFAASLGFTQPAVTQTLALMKAAGLIEPGPAADRRQRRYRLTEKSRQMLPRLQRIWAATGSAAGRLDQQLPAPLGETVRQALRVLATTPFEQMIKEELRGAASDSDHEPAGTDGPRPGRLAGTGRP